MLYWKKYTQFLVDVEFGFHWGQGEGSISIRRKDLQYPRNTPNTYMVIVCIFFKLALY